MRRRLLIAAILALILAPFALAAALLYTQSGLALIAGQLWRLERLGIHIEGLSGTLSGPLRVQRFELDHPRVQVIVHDITIDPQLRGLLLQTVRAASVTARDALVVLREADLPPSTRTPRFLPQFLRIDARRVDLAHARYVHVNGKAVEADRVRGRVTISGRHLRVRRARIEAPQFDATGELSLRAGRPFGMQGNARGHLRMQRSELALSASVDGDLDRLQIQAQLHEPQAAVARATLTRPDGRWDIAGHVQSAAFALYPWLEKPPFSLRNVALDVHANPDGVGIAGNVGIAQLDSNDLTIAASGRFADRKLSIDTADVSLQGTAARAHARGSIVFEGATPTIEVATSWQNLQWPLHGAAIVTSANGTGTLRGAMPYDFTTTAELDGPNIPAARGTARGVLSKEAVTIGEYTIQAFDGVLTGEAALQFAQPRAWRFSARAAGVNPVELHPELPGRLDLIADAAGTGLSKAANFRLTLTELSGTLRDQPVRARAIVQRDRKAWQVQDARLAFGSARMTLNGSLGDTIDARWSMNAPSLGQMLPQARGSLRFSGSATGTLKSPHVIAELNGEQLRYDNWFAGRLGIDADLDAAGALPSRLDVQASQVGRGAPLLGRVRLNGAGLASEHRLTLDLTGLAADASRNPPRATMAIAGRYTEDTWSATITTTHLSTGAPDQQFTIPQPATLLASRERVQLEGFCLVVGAGRMCAEGAWQRGGAWQATVSGYEIPLASVLPPSGARTEIAGRIEGRVHAFGSPAQPWQGDAGLRIVDAAIIYRPVGAEAQTLNLGTGGLGATANRERIEFSFGIQAFTDTFLYAGARLLREGSNDIMHLPLSGDVRGRAADANLLPLLFPEIDHAAGVLTANATVGGTLARPALNGRIELANGEFDSYRVNLALRELGIVADLRHTGVDFRGNARAGEGLLQTEGSFTWRDGVAGGDLHMRGRDLLVADLPEYRVVASPDLRFRIAGRRIDVAGDVSIPSARVQPAQLTGAVKASDDARYVGEHPAERAGRFVVHSEVRVQMGEDVLVDTFGLQGRIVGGVGTTTRTGEVPIGRGELSVEEGRYEAYGQKLEINRGRLLFDGSPLDDPGLDIEARRRIETVTVGLNVRGTLQEPRLTFFSDPSMPQTQIVTYLLTGKPMDAVAGSDTTTMNAARDALALQGGGLLASQLGRRLGLEEVGVESSIDSAGESNTALVLGKFLSPRLFISYGISLTESINTLKLRYTVSDRWVFRTEAGENQSADLEYTIER